MFTALLITIVIFYIKFISFLYILIILLANYESNKIINQKTYNTGLRYTNYVIRPKILDEVPKDVKIGTILYTAYWNLVFDITYSKIIYGKFFFIKTLSFKIILKKLFYIYFGISRFTIKLIIHILKMNREQNIENYLFSIFCNTTDHRIIVKINNEWKINNGWKNFVNTTKHLLIQELRYGDEKKLEQALGGFKNYYIKMQQIQHTTRFYNALFVKRDLPPIPHKTYLEATKDSKHHGYQTSYESAFNNKFYNKIPLINKYEGHTKKSTLLPHEAKDLRQISQETKGSNLQQLYGAYKNGYDENFLSIDYVNSIKDIKDIDLGIEKLLDEIGLNNENIKISIMFNMVQCIDSFPEEKVED